MPTLTPREREHEVTNAAMREGLISGALAAVPSFGTVWYLMRNSPRFVQITNWQSRTALVAVPTLFFFGLASEQKLVSKMHEIAAETEHAHATIEWAEKKQAQDRVELQKSLDDAKDQLQTSKTPTMPMVDEDSNTQLTELYRQSVLNSGVRVVPGDSLGWYHRLANYGQEHPIKVLAMFGVPMVGLIFYGRSGQQHLQLQMKLMHTRVLGQASVILGLLSMMGFKQYMDQNGKFITEVEANARVEEMQNKRQDLLNRLEGAKRARELMASTLKKAHEQDILEGNISHLRKADAH